MLTLRFIRPERFLPFFFLLCLSCPIEGAQTSGVCVANPTSALIFVGTLTELVDDNASWDTFQWSKATFQVTEPLQGEPLDVVSTLMVNGLCGDAAPPRVGGSYLVLTDQLPSGGIGPLMRCEQVRPASEAAPELEYLRRSQLGETPAELSGEATVEVQKNQIWRKVPLPGTKFQLTAEGRTAEFVSDENGLFRGTLKPGKYAVSIQVPFGYNLLSAITLGYAFGPIITVAEHRCTRLAISASPAGSITVHIVDVGGAKFDSMSRVHLTLETAEDQQFVRSVSPDDNSDLVMNSLPPGEYVLGLDTHFPVSRSIPHYPPTYYPPTYYPGVNKRSDSQVISLALGEHKVLPEMRLKGQECEVPVLVSEASGKPSAGAAVAIEYPDHDHFIIDSGNDQTHKEGRTTVNVVFPGPVLLSAEKKPDHHSLAQSETTEINTCPTEPILLKLNRIATLPDVQYWDITPGTGATAVSGKTVTVNYTGWLTSGKQFDTSIGRRPFQFKLGAGQVIQGWDDGVAGMKVGGKRQLRIPPNLAYGSQGRAGLIPPNATLIYDVELLDVGP